MLIELAGVIAPVLLCAAVGYLWARAGKPFDGAFVTSLVTMVGTPALVTETFARLTVDVSVLAEMATAAILALICFAAIGYRVLRWAGLPAHSYLPSLMFPNSGNMGLPLALFAFGEEGLALAIVYFCVFSVCQFTIGAAIASGELSVGRLARMPLIYAVAFSILLLATGIKLPGWLLDTLDLLGGLTIPLMLLALGVALARLRPGGLPRAVALSLVRLVGGFLVGWGLGWALGLSGPARGVLIVQSAMPVAVFNYLFAELYQRQPAEVAGMILISTILSFLTLPVLLLFVL